MLDKLQYITNGTTEAEQLNHLETVLEAGQKWIQFRFKSATTTELYKTALKAKELCDHFTAQLIINDHIELAKDLDATGVHLGLCDKSIEIARNSLGKNKIIGGTAHNFHEVIQRSKEGCDYIGLGPYRFTYTKENLSPILGLEGIRNIMNKSFNLPNLPPVFAIGGIQLNDISLLQETNIYGVAVSGLIQDDPNKKKIIQQLKNLLYEKGPL